MSVIVISLVLTHSHDLSGSCNIEITCISIALENMFVVNAYGEEQRWVPALQVVVTFGANVAHILKTCD